MFFRKKRLQKNLEEEYLKVPICNCQACTTLRDELSKKIDKKRLAKLDAITEKRRFK